MKVSSDSSRRAAGRDGLTQCFDVRKKQPQAATGSQAADALGGHVERHLPPRQPSRHPEAERHRRIDVTPGDIAEGIDHHHHDQAEGQGDPDV